MDVDDESSESFEIIPVKQNDMAAQFFMCHTSLQDS